MAAFGRTLANRSLWTDVVATSAPAPNVYTSSRLTDPEPVAALRRGSRQDLRQATGVQ